MSMYECVLMEGLAAKAAVRTQTKHLCLKHNFTTWHKALLKSVRHRKI